MELLGSVGGEHVSRVILIDQAPSIVAFPGWSEQQKAEAGALLDGKSLYDLAAGMAGPEGEKNTEGFLRNAAFTKSFPQERLDWVVTQVLKMPRHYAARLLVDGASQDWRDTIPRIDVPALVFGGKASFFNPVAQEWIAGQLRGARLHVFEEAEGGSHFMFMENPGKFNAAVTEFLA